MKKCAILIEVEDEGKVAIIVPDFSKENIIKAISENLGIQNSNIKQLSASTSYGLFSLNNGSFSSRLVQYKEYLDTIHSFIFHVEYIKVIS